MSPAPKREVGSLRDALGCPGVLGGNLVGFSGLRGDWGEFKLSEGASRRGGGSHGGRVLGGVTCSDHCGTLQRSCYEFWGMEGLGRWLGCRLPLLPAPGVGGHPRGGGLLPQGSHGKFERSSVGPWDTPLADGLELGRGWGDVWSWGSSGKFWVPGGSQGFPGD